MANHKLFEKTITTSLDGSDAAKGLGAVYYSLHPVLSAAFAFVFDYGSGGTTIDAYLQTSIDGGASWCDVANFHGVQTDLTKIINLSSLTPVTSSVTPGDGVIGANTALDGILGQHWRVKLKSAGTYGGSTTLKVYANFKTALIG